MGLHAGAVVTVRCSGSADGSSSRVCVIVCLGQPDALTFITIVIHNRPRLRNRNLGHALRVFLFVPRRTPDSCLVTDAAAPSARSFNTKCKLMQTRPI
jgi:hypothetical protein